MRFRRTTLFLGATVATWMLAMGPLQAYALAPLSDPGAGRGTKSRSVGTERQKDGDEIRDKQAIQVIQGNRKTTKGATPKNVIIMLDDAPQAEKSAAPESEKQ